MPKILFSLKFTDFIPDSFQTICFALQIYVAYESWLQKLLFTAFNNVIIYKLHKQYILVLIQFLLTSYHSEYKHISSDICYIMCTDMKTWSSYSRSRPSFFWLYMLNWGCTDMLLFFFISHTLLLLACNLASALELEMVVHLSEA